MLRVPFHPMNLIRLLLTITMFSASARAFSLASTRPAARLPYLVARMSSAGEPDTTIVDVCKKKIEDALGPDKVEVTGMISGLAMVKVELLKLTIRFFSQVHTMILMVHTSR